ncbi:hypothetical protein Leryth_018756 [Lithospermum erythrorhizon]|nr:hypothetical protein Leryth_018756 [Lithospermum erythrorhizon]
MSTTPYSPMVVIEQASPVHSRHGSVGPVIGVLAVIAVLGGVAVMVGRLCSGRKIMGHGQYDLETWVEMKFASCIDGHVSVHHPVPPPPPPLRVVVADASTTSRGSEEGEAMAVEVEDDVQEGKKEEVQEAIQEVENQQQHHETSTVVH